MSEIYVLAYPEPETDGDIAYLKSLITGPLAPWIQSTQGRLQIFEKGRTNRAELIKNAAAILAWNQGALIGAPRKLCQKAVAIDPFMDISATDTLHRWVASQLETPEQIDTAWAKSVRRLKALKQSRPILLIGPGPQTPEARKAFAGQSPFTLYLGTSLHDSSLCEALPPDVIIGADGVGQFGTSPASQLLQRKVGKALATGSQLIVTEKLGPIAHYLYPEYEEQIHVVPIGGQQDRLWQTGKSRPLGNVLTTLGLPVASILAEESEIQTLGISLSEKSQNQHWKHSQIDAMSRTAMDMLIHEPGAVLPNPNYRHRHFETLAEMIDEITTTGVKIQGSTTLKHSPKTSDITKVQAGWLPKVLAGAVGLLEYAETKRYEGLCLLICMIIFGVIALQIGFLTMETATLGISIAALLSVFLLGIFLRLRIRRWTSIFERRRRQIEAAELSALKARMDAIEAKLDKN